MKAPRICEAAARLADQAHETGWTHEEYLAAILSGEVAAREASGAESPRPAAAFPARKSLDDPFEQDAEVITLKASSYRLKLTDRFAVLNETEKSGKKTNVNEAHISARSVSGPAIPSACALERLHGGIVETVTHAPERSGEFRLTKVFG